MMREILEWRVMGERFGMGPFTPFCLVGENKTMHWHGSLAMRCWYYCSNCERSDNGQHSDGSPRPKETRLSIGSQFCSGCGQQLDWNTPVGEWSVPLKETA